eukprot:6183414-Pleurochrysis_carterae.AAC.1
MASKAQQLAAAAADKHQKLRDSYDGGVCFLTWLRLGPWSSDPEGIFSLSAKDTPPPAPGGRQAQREALLAAKATPKEPSSEEVYRAAKLNAPEDERCPRKGGRSPRVAAQRNEEEHHGGLL